MEYSQDGQDKQTHPIMPQHLYKNQNDALVSQKQIRVNWNEYTTSSVAHLFLHLIRYIKYNNGANY